MNKIAIKVKPSIEKIIRQGHPWLFEGGITKQNSEGKAGDFVVIFDNKKNKFLGIGLYDPFSPIRVKMLHANSSVQINATWFEMKIKTAYEKRLPLLQTDTNSYRLIYGENDGLPSLIADVYADVLVVKLYSPIWLPFLDILQEILLKVSCCNTLVLRLSRNVEQQKAHLNGLKDGQVLHGELKKETIIFTEHGLKFQANVIHGHKTGYFLDHRHNRKKVGELAKNKRVLDVFAYAGGFSVHALAGGAKEVISLDISKQALELSKENAALNPHKGKHGTMAIDAFEGLENLHKQRKEFDMVIIDPPSFAKKDLETERAIKSYARLAKAGINLVAKNGILVLASCSSRVSADEFFDTVTNELRHSRRQFEIIEKTFHDIDHPIGFAEGAYLKTIYFRMK
ncbi:MAG: class I SAM-dependent rRNA methyltransferase [Saprospiraceae bacterium]|nr:class I SAM-dependent rRNA methyltransferase [Saprospiraceae bacterium]